MISSGRDVHPRPVVGRHHSRPRHLHRQPRLQPAGRRPARRARPEDRRWQRSAAHRRGPLRSPSRAATEAVDAVRGASFTLGRERLGIVGESGSGKTMTGAPCCASSAHRRRSPRRPCPSTASTCCTASEPASTTCAAGASRWCMQDPKFSLNPVKTVGKQIGETYLLHFKADWQRGAPAGACDARGGADPRAGAGLRPLSAPALGRHGPAGDDRDDADRRARPADCGRAYLRARRDGAERSAAHPRRSRARAGHGADHDQP